MQPRTSFVSLLDSSDALVGSVLQSASPTVAEALGYTPLDFLFVDRQHGEPILEELVHVVRAADLSDTPVVVRIPRDAESMVTYLLDNGVRGIMVPQVEQVETVLRMSAHVRYRDGRSLGSTTRAAKFGNVPKPEYGEWVDEALALLPMVETAAGLEIVDDLARLDEVTAITIGPGDLAASLDTEFGSEAHENAIDDVFATAEAHDCPVGIFVGSETDLARYRDRAAFVVYGSDIGLLAAEYRRVLGA